MASNPNSKKLINLFKEHYGALPEQISLLMAQGSNRAIYRLYGTKPGLSCIGVIGAPNDPENRAFIEYSLYFRDHGLAVPEIYRYEADFGCYIEEDLGSTTLFDLSLQDRKPGEKLSGRCFDHYQRALTELVRFQMEAGPGLTNNSSYSRQSFGADLVSSDLKRFHNDFLKRVLPNINESAVNLDYKSLAQFVLAANRSWFMYRDFQARNIMVHDGRLYFIDYQSAMPGPLEWDVASLVYQSQAFIPDIDSEALISHYVAAAGRHSQFNEADFRKNLSSFAVLRLLQALGRYGQHGLGSGREYFLKGIPRVVANLNNLVRIHPPAVKINYLVSIIDDLQSHDFTTAKTS